MQRNNSDVRLSKVYQQAKIVRTNEFMVGDLTRLTNNGKNVMAVVELVSNA